MTVRRPAPLFGVALAFVVGTWGPDHFSAVFCAYLLVGLSLIGWFAFPSSLVAQGSFYALVALGAGFYTDLRSSLRAPDDLRLLSESKFQELSRWEGVLISAPESKANAAGTSSWVEAVFRVDRWQPALASSFVPAQGLVAIRLTGSDPTIWRYGDRLVWSGALRVPAAPRNPGQLDYQEILAQRGIFYQARVSNENATLIERNQGSWGMNWALLARDWAYRKLRLGLEDDPQTSALLAGMLFGYHQDISPELEEAFRLTGTYHVFAVSGQNVAVLLTVALLVLRLLGFLRWRWGWLCVPLLLGYCLMSGSQPSAIRALAMVLLILWAWHRQRPLCALNLWSTALLALLIYNPLILHQVGFLLSFSVVLSLILLTPWLTEMVHHPFKIDAFLPRPLWQRSQILWNSVSWAGAGLISAGLAAWLGSFPVSWLLFHQISPIALAANVVVVPLASLIVITGTLALTCGLFSSGLLLTLNQTNWFFVKLLLGTVLTCAQVPGGSWYTPAWVEESYPEQPQFIIAQTGETATGLLRYRGENWLINTGGPQEFRYVVNPLRKYFGVNSWQGVILTQLTGPEAGGAGQILQTAAVRHWFLPPASTRGAFLKPWLASLQEQKIPKEFLWQGQVWRWDNDFSMEVLAPSWAESGTRAEDRAAVLLFRYGPRTVLWAGALTASRERDLLQSYPQLRAEILIQSLPATEDSLSLLWLQHLKPKHLIQPAPSPFRTGAQTRNPLLGLPVAQRPIWWRQEDTGAIRLDLRKEGTTVRGFLNEVDRVILQASGETPQP